MRIAVVAALAALLLAACGGDDGRTPRGTGGTGGTRTAAGRDGKPSDADLYAGGCAPCHGARGAGTQLAPALNGRRREVEQVVSAVQSGVATVQPPHVPMPARGDGTWTDAQIRTVAEYVHSFAR